MKRGGSRRILCATKRSLGSTLSPSFCLYRSSSSLRYYSGSSKLSTELEYNKHKGFLEELEIQAENKGVNISGEEFFGNGEIVESINPTTGRPIARIQTASMEDYSRVVSATDNAFTEWSSIPAPHRGEILRQISNALRKYKTPLGYLVSLEVGKILPEGLGEVQEYIDVLDYSLGLSRSFAGSIIPSERRNHSLLETWNPLGLMSVITAFNFPVAVYGWNMAIGMVTGNTSLWKPADSTLLCSIATQKIISNVLKQNNIKNGATSLLCASGPQLAKLLIDDERSKIVSFTGSTHIGRQVSVQVAQRFGRSILELGGNNSIIVLNDANIELALRSVLFASVGTAGMRCTSCRRLFIQNEVYDTFLNKLIAAYKQVQIGDPLQKGTLMGPLHKPALVKNYEDCIKLALQNGGRIRSGGKKLTTAGGQTLTGNFVEPTIIEIAHEAEVVQTETFAPILWVIRVNSFEEAIQKNNSVKQGLSSSVFTEDHKKVWEWIGHNGSDCGIVNVNVPTSGAEIGGAFGGNKETGGGRESGGDSWKQYMRRGTCTINYGKELPLAQGINFGN